MITTSPRSIHPALSFEVVSSFQQPVLSKPLLSESLNGLTKICTIGQCITTTTVHRFLKVDCIIPEIPELISGTFIKGNVYTVPFDFTFPDQSDLSTCTHKVKSTCIREQHLCLPSNMGGWDREDMSPDTVDIEYAINACVEPRSTHSSCTWSDLAVKKIIRFVTKSRENLPLHIASTSQRYTLQATQTLRQHSSKQVSGIISVTAMQPEPLRLHPYGKGIFPSFIDVSVAFDPSKDGFLPPQPDAVCLCIRSYTWRQANPYTNFPDLHEVPSIKQPFCAILPVEVQSSTLAWSEHVDISEETKTTTTFYSSTLRLPLSTVSSTKTILPTFYSCLVSRTYDVCVRLKSGKRELVIVTPVQIIAEI